MNPVETSTIKTVAHPSPLFGSIWLALYGLLRDYQSRMGAAHESPATSKVTLSKQL